MTADRISELADAYLGALAEAGIVLRHETAESTIRHRMHQFATGVGLSAADVLDLYDAEMMRSWAREAAAQLRDEQPHNPLLTQIPERVAPIGMLARCVEILIGTHPALAQRTAANLATYPAILLGGLAVVRCKRTDLAMLAAVLADTHPALSRKCLLLAGPAA